MGDERRIVRRLWISNERKPLDQLLVMVRDMAGDAEVAVSRGAAFTWDEPETDDEMAYRQESERRADARHEKWERETYVRLKEKFEG